VAQLSTFDKEMSTATDAKSLIAVLDNEIAHLRSVYSTYARLYGSDSDTRNLLSDSDAAFFGDLYKFISTTFLLVYQDYSIPRRH